MAILKMLRVDDRLVHGQISTRWCRDFDMDMLVVINDECAMNKIQQGLYEMALPESIQIRYYSIAQAIEKVPQLTGQRQMLIVVDKLEDLRILIESGVDISYINLGHIPMKPGRHRLTPETALSDEEITWLQEVEKRGIQVDIRRLPTDEPVRVQ